MLIVNVKPLVVKTIVFLIFNYQQHVSQESLPPEQIVGLLLEIQPLGEAISIYFQYFTGNLQPCCLITSKIMETISNHFETFENQFHTGFYRDARGIVFNAN